MKVLKQIVWLIFFLGLIMPYGWGESSPGKKNHIIVTQGDPPVLDKTVADDEWADAVLVLQGQNRKIFLKSHNQHLYLAYKGFPSKEWGFACLFLKVNKDVYILHASAQLGTAIYRFDPESKKWNPKSATYQWKTAEKSWHSEGWKARTTRESAPGEQEFAINLGFFFDMKKTMTLWLALGYLHGDSKGTTGTLCWPEGLEDSCKDEKLLGGWNPKQAWFDMDKWATLILTPTPKLKEE